MSCLQIRDVSAQSIDLSVLGGQVVLCSGKQWAESRKLFSCSVNLRLRLVNSTVELSNLSLTLILPSRVQPIILCLVIMHVRSQLIQHFNNGINGRPRVHLDLNSVQQRLAIGGLVDLGELLIHWDAESAAGRNTDKYDTHEIFHFRLQI
jgi:hypothetical protein